MLELRKKVWKYRMAVENNMETGNLKQLDLNREKELTLIGKALSSPIRIQILRLLEERALNVNEIAEELKIPPSTSALHVKVLEEAELIFTELLPGVRGSKKLCHKKLDELDIKMSFKREETEEVFSMPIGNFVDYKVEPTCGIVNEKGHIDKEDEPRCFYHPNRTTAKLIWFGKGYVEYRFPNHTLQNNRIKSIEISAELCSETADYNLDCPSDITLFVNGLEAGTWNCPSDFGGRRGRLNPDWWPDKNTQYGKLKKWKINSQGSFIDDKKVSTNKLEDYKLAQKPYLSVRIGIKEEAEHIGGINILGDSFGDYPQNIELKITYESDEIPSDV